MVLFCLLFAFALLICPRDFTLEFDKNLRYGPKIEAAIWRLISSIGPHQLPTSLTSQQQFGISYFSQHQDESTWWDIILPEDSFEKERQEVHCAAPCGLPTHEWTLFDSDKLEVSQVVLENAIFFIRTKIENSSETAVDYDAILNTLQNMVHLHQISSKYAGVAGQLELSQALVVADNDQMDMTHIQQAPLASSIGDLSPESITIQMEGLLAILDIGLANRAGNPLSQVLSPSTAVNLIACMESISQRISGDNKFMKKLSRSALAKLQQR